MHEIPIPDWHCLPYHLLDPFNPFLLTNQLKCMSTDIVFIRHALLQRMMGELKIRDQSPINEQRRPHSGSERQHHLHSLTSDTAIPLNISIISNLDRPMKQLLELQTELSTWPMLVEIDSCHNHARANDPWESN